MSDGEYVVPDTGTPCCPPGRCSAMLVACRFSNVWSLPRCNASFSHDTTPCPPSPLPNSHSQALIDAIGGPLLSHSIHVPSIDMSDDEYLVPDTGTLMDMYGSRGLDFIVEVGQRKTKPSSVSGEQAKALLSGGGVGGLWTCMASKGRLSLWKLGSRGQNPHR